MSNQNKSQNKIIYKLALDLMNSLHSVPDEKYKTGVYRSNTFAKTLNELGLIKRYSGSLGRPIFDWEALKKFKEEAQND